VKFSVVVFPGSNSDYDAFYAASRVIGADAELVWHKDTGPVLGICNGFQVLLEAGLLPGAMVRNDRIKFVSRIVPVRVEQTDTPFTGSCASQQVLHLPIAHGEGNYYAPPDVLAEIEAHRQVIFRYTDASGQVSAEHNPNGSLNSIAGICNRQRNVVGLMPHPERASEAMLGSADGRVVLASAVRAFQEGMLRHA
jgi:phosphoribosylformylglycinamidine synthase I